MICIRCGYCCINLCVVIVDNPELGIVEGNLIVNNEDGGKAPCKHLEKGKDGRYSCKIHGRPWYKDTPCAKHTLVGRDDMPCRMGVYQLAKEGRKWNGNIRRKIYGQT